jgi:hypothetical protein
MAERIPQLNRIELNRATRVARFLEPTVTLSIRVFQSGKGKLVPKEETGYGKRQGGSAIRHCL